MTTIQTVQNDAVVSIHYTLKNDAGEVLDSSLDGEPLAYLHGAHNIVPGLESELEGKSAGDELDVVVAPKDGYGEKIDEIMEVDRSSFPEDAELEAGMQFAAETEEGFVPLWIDRVEGDTVYVDPNHPLAGVTLHFSVRIEALRECTEAEREQGHPGEED